MVNDIKCMKHIWYITWCIVVDVSSRSRDGIFLLDSREVLLLLGLNKILMGEKNGNLKTLNMNIYYHLK